MSLKERLNLNNNKELSVSKNNLQTTKYNELFEQIINENQNVVICCPIDIEQGFVFNLSDEKIPPDKRIVAIGKNLNFSRSEIIKFEPDTQNLSKNLIKTAIELKPYKIILQDFTGCEAIDILKLINSGIKNIVTSVMAETAQKALTQMEFNLYSSGVNIPENLMKKLVSSFVDKIVEIEKIENSINISKIYQIKSIKNNEYLIEEIIQDNIKKEIKKDEIKNSKAPVIIPEPIPSAAKVKPDILKKKLDTNKPKAKIAKKNILAAKLKRKLDNK